MLKDILPTLPTATFLSKSLRQPKHQQLNFVRRKGVFSGQVSQNANSSVKRQGFPDKRGVRSPGQMRTVVFQTDTDRGLTDKRGLRFTDRRSSDFPDTCHLDFPDALHLNFPDASYLTKATKIRNDRVTVSDGSGRTYRLGTRGRGPRAGGPGPPRVLPRRDVVNQPHLHPVSSFAERHPANSPHGDFSQQIPKATKTPATRFCPEKGRILRTSESKYQFIRKKAGFSGQTRGKVSWTDADCGLPDRYGPWSYGQTWLEVY